MLKRLFFFLIGCYLFMIIAEKIEVFDFNKTGKVNCKNINLSGQLSGNLSLGSGYVDGKFNSSGKIKLSWLPKNLLKDSSVSAGFTFGKKFLKETTTDATGLSRKILSTTREYLKKSSLLDDSEQKVFK